jgi:hypothetical protein
MVPTPARSASEGKCVPRWRFGLVKEAIVSLPRRDAATKNDASLYGIVAPGNVFENYLMFLLFPLAFLSAVILAALHEAPLGLAARRALAAVALAAAVVVPTARALEEGNPWLEEKPQPPDPVTALIRRYAAPGENLVVWGWMDRYYVLTAMRPATFQCNSAYILNAAGTPRGDYFYRLFLEQLDQARPPVFVDAVGPGAFKYENRSEFGHENFSDLRNLITAHYVMVGEANEARVYISRERLAERCRGR